MTTIDPMMTLGALVNSHPEFARELERRGLDYCCGGGQTLFDACISKGIDSTLTAMELAAVVGDKVATDWSTMEALELVDHLESTHHRYLWEELPRLSALMVKIVSAHGERHPELHAIAACYGKVRADLEPHLTKEERVVPDDSRVGGSAIGAVVPLRYVTKSHFDDAAGARRCRRIACPVATLDRWLSSTCGWLSFVQGVLRWSGGTRGGYPSPHPQGKQSAISDGGAHGE